MSEPTDKEIRQAIAAKIVTALDSVYGAGHGIRVHDRWILSFGGEETANSLKILSGANTGKVHGWMVGLDSVSRERQDPKPQDTMQGWHRLYRVNPPSRYLFYRYRVWGFFQYNTGQPGNESNENSENTFTTELTAISDEFSRDPRIGINNNHLMGHLDLQFSEIDTYPLGGIMANGAKGSLTVVVQHRIV